MCVSLPTGCKWLCVPACENALHMQHKRATLVVLLVVGVLIVVALRRGGGEQNKTGDTTCAEPGTNPYRSDSTSVKWYVVSFVKEDTTTSKPGAVMLGTATHAD